MISRQFKEAIEKEERGYSVNDVINDMDLEQYNELIIIGVGEDNSMYLSYSCENYIKAVGILEVIKSELLNGGQEI